MSETKTDNNLVQKETNTLNTLNKKCEQLEIENTKLQNHIFQLEKTIKTYRDNNTNLDNTSTNCLLNSEFIQLWNEFALVDLINNFIDFECEPKILYHLIQEMFLLMQNEISDYSSLMINKITSMLKLSNSEIIQKTLCPIFKEFCNNIFSSSLKNNEIDFTYDSFMNKYKEFFENKIIHSKEQEEYFNEAISSIDFIKMLDHIKQIILYLNYNNSQFSIVIQPYEKREYDIREYSNKTEVLNPFNNCKSTVNINGVKSLNSYLVLLEPPRHNKLRTDFKGILPIAYQIDKEFIKNTVSLNKLTKHSFISNNTSSIMIKNYSNTNSIDTSGEEISNEISTMFKNVNRTNIMRGTGDFIEQNIEKENKIKNKSKTISSLRLNSKKKFSLSKTILSNNNSYVRAINSKNQINNGIKKTQSKQDFYSNTNRDDRRKDNSNPKRYTSSNQNIFTTIKAPNSYSKIAFKQKSKHKLISTNKNIMELSKLLSVNDVIYSNNKSVLIKIKHRKKDNSTNNNTSKTSNKYKYTTNEILQTDMNTNSNTANPTEDSITPKDNESDSVNFTKLKNETRNNPLFVYDINPSNTNLNPSSSDLNITNKVFSDARTHSNKMIFKKMKTYTKAKTKYIKKSQMDNKISFKK